MSQLAISSSKMAQLCPGKRVGLSEGEKWNIPCGISKQGCHSHQWFQPSQCEFLSPKRNWKGEYLQHGSHEAAATPQGEHWGTQDVTNTGYLPRQLGCIWKNDFSMPRLWYLPISSVHHSVMSDSLWPHGLYIPLQAPLSMGMSRQDYWSGLPFPSPGDLPNPGIKSGSSALQADFLTWDIWFSLIHKNTSDV